MAPMYDFECEQCKHIFEENVPYEKSNEVKCIKCGHPADKVFIKGPPKHGSWSLWDDGRRVG